MKKYYKSEDPNKRGQQELEFEAIKAYIPPMIHAKLKDASRLQGLPMSRLMAIALDNEFDQEMPFHYPTDLLDEPYEEYAYVNEANKILDYLCKFRNGIGRDALLLSRRDLGIEKREDILRGLRELYEKDMIEDVVPRRTRFTFWLNSYRVVRVKDVIFEERKPKKMKRIDHNIKAKGVHRINDEDVE